MNKLSEVTNLTTSAVDRKTGKLIYTEERKQADRPDGPGVWRFVYKNLAGETIVRRIVNFEHSALKPAFRLDDLRNGYAEGAEIEGDKIKVFTGGSLNDPFEEKLLDVPEPAIIDAGFNFFVEQNWDRLMNGEVLPFNFVAPSQLDYVKLRVYRSGTTTHKGRPVVELNMDIDNFFLRLFVEAIHLKYDEETKLLVVYNGISNIYDDNGKSHKVRMEFNYQ
ncbi:hypothetical protein JNM05_05980 [bacterium]|nr:hypothetical protein [bacterium]